MNKHTTALAECGHHHIAIPKDELKRTAESWSCPYCEVNELKNELKDIESRARKYPYSGFAYWVLNREALNGEDDG